MSNIPNLLDHAPFTFTNTSNFDVQRKEMVNDSVLDVPVFPAQNIVLDTKSVNIYDTPDPILTFVYESAIYSLIKLADEQRAAFMKYEATKRGLFYRFGGRIYPQHREEASYCLTETSLYVFGGKDESRGRREIWRLDLSEMTWYPLHPIGEDVSLSDFPSGRWDSNIVVQNDDIYIFGGKNYSEIGNTVLTINDCWFYNSATSTWKVLDDGALLPHDEDGIVVYWDASIIKILADGKLWTVYKDGTTATTFVSSTQSVPSEDFYTTYMDGKVHLVTDTALYRWNNTGSTLSVVKSGITGVGLNVSQEMDTYSIGGVDKIRRGGDSVYQPNISIYHPKIMNEVDDTVRVDCPFDAVPLGQYMATCDMTEGRKYLGLGYYQGKFNEDHAIWDGQTLNTSRIGSDSYKPQERLAASCCFDEERNRIWLFGGYSGSFYYNDLWYLELDTGNWIRVSPRVSTLVDENDLKVWPAHRARAGMCVVEDTLWVVSGYSDEQAYADMWKYDIGTGNFTEEILTDWVPFGTNYMVFTWRDRMWLFNGEKGKLYRYFYSLSQWYPVVVYSSRQDSKLTQEIEAFEQAKDDKARAEDYANHPTASGLYTSWRGAGSSSTNTSGNMDPNSSDFMLPPMRLAVQGNNLIISYSARNKISGGESFKSTLIDMDSKEQLDFPGQIYNATFWRDQALGMDASGYVYYYNLSPFDLAQRNQIPYFEYSISPVSSEFPLAQSSSIMPYWDPDIVGGTRPRLAYLDQSNMYIIYDDDVEYSPLMPTIGEMQAGLWGSYWPQNDFSVFGYPTMIYDEEEDPEHEGTPTIEDWTEQNLAKEAKGKGRFRTIPRYLWKRIPPRFTKLLRDAALSWQDENTQRTYLVNSESGYVIRFRSDDGTSMSYPSRVWREAAVAHRGQVVYAFGGSLIGGSPILDQNGDTPDYGYPSNVNGTYVLDSHNGLMMYDLNYIGFQMRLLQENPEMTAYDYDNIRDYFVQIARAQGLVLKGDVPEDWIETITESLYSSTLAIAGDLAVRTLVHENGVRPQGPRAGCVTSQVSSNLYVGGGAYKWFAYVVVEGEISSCSVHYDTSWNGITYNDFHKFDTSTKTWTQLADLPSPIYGGTLFEAPDGLSLWLVGGFKGSGFKNPNDLIYKYNIETDAWVEFGPTPENYIGRGLPTCAWLDDYRMLIQFGFTANVDNKAGKVNRIPVGDAWLVDIQTEIMYKIFENHSKTSVIEDGLMDDSGYIDLIDYFEPVVAGALATCNLNKGPQALANAGPTIASFEGLEDDSVMTEALVPREDLQPDGSLAPALTWWKIDPVDGSVKHAARVEIPLGEMSDFNPSRVMQVFRDWNQDPWLVLNTTRGPRFYRWATMNEFLYEMDYLPIDLPLESACDIIAWDGISRLICVWNAFNIWELDLRVAAYNPNGEYWRQLPPNPDLDDIGILGASSGDLRGITSVKWINNEILLYKANGGVYRYDQEAMLWRVDRLPRTSKWGYNVVVKDGGELYYYKPGTTGGHYYDILQKQADKFYFDAELMENTIDIPVISSLLGNAESEMKVNVPGYGSGLTSSKSEMADHSKNGGGWSTSGMIDFLTQRRSTVRRNRIMSFNKNNHLMRAWTRKHGVFEAYFEFPSYYSATRIDVSVDYDTMSQADRFEISVMTDEGWVTGAGNTVEVDTGYDWDPFSRKYRKQVVIPGGYTYIETTRPGYMVRLPLDPGTKARAVKVYFYPKAEEWSYIAKINHIYVVTDDGELELRDESEALQVFYIEPFDTDESDVYLVHVKNVHQTQSAYSPRVFIRNNYRILMSLDNQNWERAGVDNPLVLASDLNPGASASFYLKAVSYFDKSNLDLVLTADYPLND